MCRNKTEKILYNNLNKKYPDVKIQSKYDWCMGTKNRHYPFDFVIENINVIIELDGNQHFRDVAIFKNNFNKQRECDVYKMIKANENGYSVIRLLQTDVYGNKNNWEKLLYEAINKVQNGIVTNQYIAKTDMYKQHIEDLELLISRPDNEVIFIDDDNETDDVDVNDDVEINEIKKPAKVKTKSNAKSKAKSKSKSKSKAKAISTEEQKVKDRIKLDKENDKLNQEIDEIMKGIEEEVEEVPVVKNTKGSNNTKNARDAKVTKTKDTVTKPKEVKSITNIKNTKVKIIEPKGINLWVCKNCTTQYKLIFLLFDNVNQRTFSINCEIITMNTYLLLFY